MKAKCLQECYDGKKCWKYTPDGGENKDGIYDVDPLEPIAQYFEFPPGTVKYHKIPGNVKDKTKPQETTIKVSGEFKEQTEKPGKEKEKPGK